MSRSATKAKAAWEQKREAERTRQVEASASGRDIAPLPPVKNRRRKNRCERDFGRFLKTYLVNTFPLPFCADHKTVIARGQASVLEGGFFPVAMPRGSGKTSIAEGECLWAILYGHRCFVVLIGSDEGRANDMLASIKVELETNALLHADFPEVCHPVVSLERISHRCKGQTFKGEPTYLGWTAGELVLATIPGSKASGGVVVAAGLTASIRGLKHKRPDGTATRPDLVVCDDCQTDESARSASQCDYRERVLKGAVMGLAGPKKKIAGIMPCTVIAAGDLADRMLRDPEWNGERMKMLYREPDNAQLWEKYAQVRAEGLKGGDGGRSATEFYRANREAMDLGAEVAWPERYNPGELSALQHAVNLRLMDPHAFASEYQNDPLPPPALEASRRIDPEAVARRTNGLQRGVVPTRAGTLTAFIDVQQDLLYFAVCGWEEGFTGHLIDYGTYPDQRRPYYKKTDARPSLAVAVGVSGLEGSIWRGLEALVEQILGRQWLRPDGSAVPVSRLLIDSGWQTDLVYRFCLQGIGRKYQSALTPSKGMFFSARRQPMNEWAPKPPERRGPGWVHRGSTRGRPELLLIDANAWKTFLACRLAQEPGEKGAFFLYGTDPREHRLLCDHLSAEYRELKDGVEEWTLLPDRPDNEFLDCLTGAAVAASREGVKLANVGEKARPAGGPRKTWKEMAEAQKARREARV